MLQIYFTILRTCLQASKSTAPCKDPCFMTPYHCLIPRIVSHCVKWMSRPLQTSLQNSLLPAVSADTITAGGPQGFEAWQQLLIPGLQIDGEPGAAVLGRSGRPVKGLLESKPFQGLPGYLGSRPPWVVAGIHQGRRVKAQPKMWAWAEPQGPSSTVSEGSKLHPLAASKRQVLAQLLRLSLPPPPLKVLKLTCNQPSRKGTK